MARIPETASPGQVSDCRVLRFDCLDSTNEEALRQLAGGAALPLWIVAAEQRKGRGRNGRLWHSPKGNLYASLLMRTAAPLPAAPQLSFAAALAAHDAIQRLLPQSRWAEIRLKWPNDIMLDGKKVAGILLECRPSEPDAGLAVVIGIGINLATHPKGLARDAADLGLSGDRRSVDDAFRLLAGHCQHWLDIFDSGKGFPAIRAAWLDRAFALHEPMSADLNGRTIRGKFAGLAESGALEIETAPGNVVTIIAGDVAPGDCF